ncbi:hypothetical protein BH10CHL1_BH10CHL1_15760 [soil metagenome]
MIRKIGWSVLFIAFAFVGLCATVFARSDMRIANLANNAATSAQVMTGRPSVAIAQVDAINQTDSVTQTDSISQTDSITESDSVTQTDDVTSTDAITSTDSVTETDAVTETDSVTETDAVTAAQTSSVTAPITNVAPSSVRTIGAVGTIDLTTRYQVVLDASGKISDVNVEVGDEVSAGDLIVALDTTDLQAAVKKAEMNLETARLAFEELSKGVDPSDIALSEAQLMQASETLTKTLQGPTDDELKAAESSSEAAWAAYNDLKAGPTASKKIQAQAALKQAQLTLQEAQRAYDKISWQPDAGTSSEGATLQKATIDYEAAQAAYDDLIKPATTADLQSALSDAYTAQNALQLLKDKPTAGDVGEAKANVAVAQATLAKTKLGPTKADLRTSEIAVESALIDLEQARKDLNNAQLKAPLTGTILAVNVEPGQVSSSGDVAVVMADTSKIKLVVNVEQKDINQIKIGQNAEISIYALPGQTFKGVVEKIAPVSSSTQSFVGFPVTLRFTDSDMSAVIPGMTASATFATNLARK